MNFNILELLGFVFVCIICYIAFLWTLGKLNIKTESVTMVERDGKLQRLGSFSELLEAVQSLAAYNPPRESPEGELLTDLVAAINKFKRGKAAKILSEGQDG